ncbi:MAG: LPS export ABC transporter permease LptG [Thermoanaerobaculia bacterium]|nr:LPS export ABC transporter permease LptG [Thermoanaerobaculia bacterium]
MKILTRYILKEMIGPTLLGFTFYTSIILMQQLFTMAGMIITRSLTIGTVGKLLALSLPHIVVLTVPMSLLFGVLIAVGRLSSDSEIIAMRALGISTRTIYLPVFVFSFAIFLLNLYLINVVMPKGNTRFKAIQAEVLTSSVQKEIRPRVVYDEYENLMIYVNDTDPATGQWKGVFVADSRTEDPEAGTTPSDIVNAAAARENEDPNASSLVQPTGQRIIIADSGSISVVQPSKQVWMNLRRAQSHLWDPRRPERYDLNRNETQRLMVADSTLSEYNSAKLSRSLREMNLGELVTQARMSSRYRDRTYNLARVEIHKKFSIPFACLVFGILGLPLGITNRRGGRSSGFSLSIGIILLYYVMINNGEHLAGTGAVPPGIAMWTPNIILLALGIYLLRRANRDAGAQRTGGNPIRKLIGVVQNLLVNRRSTAESTEEGSSVLSRLDITFPNILDRYILKQFLKILGLVLVSVMSLFVIVDYTEISGDIRANEIPFHTVFAYYRFLIFEILNWTLPISVLVATLVTFGVLSKNNEVTAIKSGGVSLYRIALPIVAVAGLISAFSYLVQDFVLPYSTQRSETLRRVIEGKKPLASSSGQQRLWFFGRGRYLINFLSYDRDRQALSQVQVFEFHPTQFRLARRVFAQSAKWDGRAWSFNNGWIRSFNDAGQASFTPITKPVALQYSETPDDFETEAKSPAQMTFAQLRRYVDTIRATGYAADELSVKLYSKTSWPFISLVMALIALPFAFRAGKRGALYGIGIALVLGITYWMIFAVFTKFGEVGNLPPMLSAWSANILFAIAAVYMFLHVET